MNDKPEPVQLPENVLDSLDAAIDRAVAEADAKKQPERVAMIDKEGVFGDTQVTSSIDPFEHLQIQIWQSLAYAASNCVLISKHLGNKDLEDAAYDMLDSANECMKRAVEIFDQRRAKP